MAIENFHSNIIAMNNEEKLFFSTLGVSQDLFERSCTSDKGLKDGNSYSFLLPTPQSFEKYGIKNVEGVQDAEVAQRYPGKLAVD